jgi:hypothetical protein
MIEQLLLNKREFKKRRMKKKKSLSITWKKLRRRQSIPPNKSYKLIN